MAHRTRRALSSKQRDQLLAGDLERVKLYCIFAITCTTHDNGRRNDVSDKRSKAIREQLDRKPPGEPLTLEEIRELKLIEAERANRAIEEGTTDQLRSRLWEKFWAEKKKD